MKKLLSLFSLLLLGTSAYAQSTVTVHVDRDYPAWTDVAVFLFEGVSPANFMNQNYAPLSDFSQVGYTNGTNGVTFTLNNPTQSDTILYLTYDCRGDIEFNFYTYNPGLTNVIDSLSVVNCTPDTCDAVLFLDTVGGTLNMSAYSLVSLMPANHYAHLFTVNNQRYLGNPVSPNHATYSMPLPAPIGGYAHVLYQRDTACAGDSASIRTNRPPSCNALFYVDSINSINYQGQLLLIESSTASRGTISYSWDFGDGSAPYNTQYPQHTYSSVAAKYQVCLTITAIDGYDTCRSTYCDSVEFDVNGTPVFKNGFTVNVIDPATFSVDENEFESVRLFPNPSAGPAMLTWDVALDVERVEIISTDGKLLNSVEPTTNEIELSEMPTGVYLVRLQSATGVTTQRWIVQ